MTEKWQALAPMLFEISDAAACAINEHQLVVAGGVDSSGRLTDIVQIFDSRENTWRLFDVCLSVPRRRPALVSSQKDRVMIIGGREASHNESQLSRVVEEIDFLKRNIVNLASLVHARAAASAFTVNDSIFVFGGAATGTLGEKYSLSENKWREVGPCKA